MRKLIAISFLLCTAFVGFSQSVEFHSRLDSNRILIGEQTTFYLTAEGLNDEKTIWPVWPDTLQGIEVLSSLIDSIKTGETWTVEQSFVVTSFDSGFVVIPPLALITENERFESEPQILNVTTIELDPEKDFYDIKEPVKAPIDWLYWLKRLWFVALIAAVIIAILLWLWLKKRKEQKSKLVYKDTRTPAQRARATLMQIRDKRIWQDGNVKEYYSAVTDAARLYLEESYPVPAMEMVSDELIEAMQTHISADAQQLLRQTLQTADMVKFAKAKPGPDQHAQLWDNAMHLIDLTEPSIQISPDAG